MAVFTPLSDAQVAAFLEKFDVGSFVALQGVAGGTENSTFFVTTDRRELVLTLFEQGEHEELPFFVELLDYLDEHRLPVPGTIHDREGVALHCVNPLTWRANQSRRGERKRHHGGVPPDLSGIDPELTDAGCNNGILYISPPAVPAYEIRGGNYHALDYNLFYINLRRNLAERLGVH